MQKEPLSLFPEVEIIALATDLELRLQKHGPNWHLNVKYVGLGSIGEAQGAVLTPQQAAAVMALFVTDDLPMESALRDIIGDSLGDCSGDWSPIP
jgi:hypothetical protein